LLYDRGAEVDVQASENRTPLRGASSSGHLEIVQWLLSRGANSTARAGGLGFTPLHAAADFEQVEVSRLLLQYKADICARDRIGRTPLHIAVEGPGRGIEQVNITRFLLEHGADVNAPDNKRKTPLHRALEWGNLDVARLLVEYGANIVAEDDDGRTVSQVAAERGYHDFVKFLSDRGSK
jgi:ankyrin repeat protein